MRIEKITADTTKLALEKAKILLGEDAVILNQKEVQSGGFFGLFSKKYVEIIAASDGKPKQKSGKKKVDKPVSKQAPEKPAEPKKPQVISEPALPDFSQSSEPIKSEPTIKPVMKPPIKSESENSKDNENSKRLAEELKKNKELSEQLQSLKSQQIKQPSSEFVQFFPEPLQKLHSHLKEQEVDESYSESLISGLLEKCYLKSNDLDYETVKKWAHERISQDLSIFKFGGIKFQKKYINIIGPTGVGKTTTIAKIAALSKMEHKKKVALITADTYRISAVEQLKAYAKILGLPMETIYSVEDFKKAKEQFKDYDLVLVDTAGRNYRDAKYIEDLKNVIDFNEEVENLLVLSLTSKYKDMKDIYNQFSTTNINQLIFTKADETGNYGSMINLLMETKKGVAYLTNGQEVPDDIIEASPRTIADTLLKDGR